MNKTQVYIVTGQIGSGKTTRLSVWLKDKNAAGILSPIVEGKRIFRDINDGDFKMEAGENEKTAILIGKYKFSKHSFKKAISIIEDGFENNFEWIVIDEIGPLELEGKGFNKVLKFLLFQNKKNIKLLIVVRESILIRLIDKFNLRNFGKINI